jgi:MinD-like ATPase involved in chromosome partitioning or flagellar assembly
MPKRSFPPRDPERPDPRWPGPGALAPPAASGPARAGAGAPTPAGDVARPATDAGAATPDGDIAPAPAAPVPAAPAPAAPAPAGPAPTPAEPSSEPRTDQLPTVPPALAQPDPARSQPPAWAIAADRPAQTVAARGPAEPDTAPRQPAEPPPEPPPSRRRRAIPRTTGPGLRTPRSTRQAERPDELVARIRRPLSGPHQVAVVSLKGGEGRTTTAALLGLTLAEHRDDRVIALDASPAGGTLADRLVGGADTGVRELLDQLDEVRTLADVDRFTAVVGRLRVLASDQDLGRNVALNSLEYERVCLLLQRHFPVIVTDGAAGPALAGTLALAHSVVVVGSLTVDGAGRAGKTLDWLVAHGYRDAAARAVLVLDGDRASGGVDADRLRAHFAARCRAVLEIPHDRHLAQGGLIDAAALAPGTRAAALHLAALIADEFGTVTAGRRQRA